MDSGKKGRNQHKASADHRSDRKSATGMSGDPKKGGRGGKFTWEGADGYADEDLDLISDKNNGPTAKGGDNAAKKDDDEDLDLISDKNNGPTAKGGDNAAKKDDDE